MKTDFNGDGLSDVLWLAPNGDLIIWFADDGGTLRTTNNAAIETWGGWHVPATGDFNGDGRDDILLMYEDGRTLTNWLGADGGVNPNYHVFAPVIAADWAVAGSGDFNGDARDDILWRHHDGTFSTWHGQSNGSLVEDRSETQMVPTSWQIVGIGDFNGDKLDDVLWRNADGTFTNWLGGQDGFTHNWANFSRTVSFNWYVNGVGDFDGDGKDDILWRNTDGTLTNWLGRNDGSFTDNWQAAVRSVPTDWDVIAIGDYNGDQKSDILWRNHDGTITDWLATSDGAFAENGHIFWDSVSTNWQIQPVFYGFGQWDY